MQTCKSFPAFFLLAFHFGDRSGNGSPTSVGALTYDYAVRTLQFSGVSHNIDVPALDWLSNDELGDYVALKLSVQIPVSGSTGNAVQNCIFSIILMTFHFGDGSENGFPT